VVGMPLLGGRGVVTMARDDTPAARALRCYAANVPTPDSARSAFAEAFGVPATVVARAPGRVNLIGEHTDYSGLPVLPIAIDRSLLVAAAPDDSGVVEVRSEAFEASARFSRADPDDGVAAPWHGYLAGALGQLAGVAPGRGAQVLVSGDLPAEGG